MNLMKFFTRMKTFLDSKQDMDYIIISLQAVLESYFYTF